MSLPERYSPSKKVTAAAIGVGLVATFSSLFCVKEVARNHTRLYMLERPAYVVAGDEILSTTVGSEQQIDQTKRDRNNALARIIPGVLTLLASHGVLGVQNKRSRRQENIDRQTTVTMISRRFEATTNSISVPQGFAPEDNPLELHHWGEDLKNGAAPELGEPYELAEEINFPSHNFSQQVTLVRL